MTGAWDTPATGEQLSELRRLATLLGEELPVGLRRHEAAQRVDEWRRHALLAVVDVSDAPLSHSGGHSRPVEVVRSPLL